MAILLLKPPSNNCLLDTNRFPAILEEMTHSATHEDWLFGETPQAPSPDASDPTDPAPVQPVSPMAIEILPPEHLTRATTRIAAATKPIIEDSASSDLPPWERYEPKRDALDNILVDAKAEFRAGLHYKSFADRLRRNGVAERALEILVDLMQSPDVNPRIRVDAAKALLAQAYGTPQGSDSSIQQQVLIQIDI